VMLRTTDDSAQHDERLTTTVKGATHIVKFWESTEYPELAANEFFCLQVAQRLGLEVPRNRLSDNGAAFVVERFDLKPDGSFLGFEDFCVLNGLTARDKYNGGYESRLFKRTAEFVSVGAENRRVAMRDLFRLFVLNVAVRNGDGHLKQYGVTYDDVTGVTKLAPVYDIVTTQVYLPKDAMALTLGGTTRWPARKGLLLLGQTRCGLTAQDAREILEATADAIADTAVDAKPYFEGHSLRAPIGERLFSCWADGVRDSLGFEEKSVSIRPFQADESSVPSP
jgi:serine/threonine-protein kinase HipA